MGSRRAASGYVDDVPYMRGFIPELSPAWLDFTALLWGFAPADRTGGFAWCDLGCGQGVNAAVFAATHPGGQFHGVDFLPEHIDHARGLAAAAGARNATFPPPISERASIWTCRRSTTSPRMGSTAGSTTRPAAICAASSTAT